MMDISYNTAKWAAPVAFAVDFACQIYGILSTPNMKDINDANLSFFSPQSYFIAAFFFPQQLLQLGWLYRLWKLGPSSSSSSSTSQRLRPQQQHKTERDELDLMLGYVPFYVLGNLCIAAWMVAWNANRLDISDVFVALNSFAQLYYITVRLERMNTKSTSSVMTHIVSKTFAGIGVLDFLHNTSAAFFKDQSPSLPVKILTGVGFAAGCAFSDWIFGACLVYDLVALAVGQSGSWRIWLSIYAVGAAGIVAAKNFAKPPYSNQYSLAPDDEDEEDHNDES